MPREIRLASRPTGMPAPENFALAESVATPLGEGEVRVENRWLSVDPYMRGRMIDRKNYVPPFELGRAMEGSAMGVVVESRAPSLPVGARVVSMLGWREVAQGPARAFQAVPGVAGVPDQAWLGVLGIPGMTAWVGLNHVARLAAGETVFVSGAAGAVGSAVCQLAKMRGCTVIGSAGGPAKVAFLRGLGVDAAIDYRAGGLTAALEAAAPKGIHVYFDNVGGDHLEAAMAAARPFARLVECGMIAQYNDEAPTLGPRNMTMIVGKRLRLEGFIVSDHIDKLAAFVGEVAPLVAGGRMRWEETVMDGLDAMPAAFMGLFTGANTGKMLVRL